MPTSTAPRKAALFPLMFCNFPARMKWVYVFSAKHSGLTGGVVAQAFLPVTKADAFPSRTIISAGRALSTLATLLEFRHKLVFVNVR